MKVFLSWSGAESKAVAEALRDWLPNVLRSATAWLSANDIDKGANWLDQLNTALTGCQAGIVVVTASNRDAPWVNFEAGVISNGLQRRRCCTVGYRLGAAAISGPLAQFQFTDLLDKSDVYKLVGSLNGIVDEERVPDDRLRVWFDKFHGELESALAQVASPASADVPDAPSDSVLLAELLGTVRRIERAIGLPAEVEAEQFRKVRADFAALKMKRALEDGVRCAEEVRRAREQGLLPITDTGACGRQ